MESHSQTEFQQELRNTDNKSQVVQVCNKHKQDILVPKLHANQKSKSKFKILSRLVTVGTQFVTQAQNGWNISPMSPIQ